MRVLWITHRKFNDFCATTPRAFASGLVDLGFDLTVLNPDSEEENKYKWKHIGLGTKAIRGLQGRIFSKHILERFEELELDFDAYILDWQVGVRVAKRLVVHGKPLFLMDRSPPADSGILAKLQWKVWKDAWKLVKKGIFKSGFVVSSAHHRFVSQSFNIPGTKISVLEAGVATSEKPAPLSREGDEIWKFIYHGRLDKHRGFLDFMEHIVAWNDIGIPCHLTFIGEGTSVSAIKKMQAKNPDLFTLKDPMSHQKVVENLKEYHIGILPMPATKVWKLASPLKRGEYLASGLLVVGLDHDGHRLEEGVGPWMQLYEPSILRTKISSFLHSMSDNEFNEYSQSAIEFAREHLSWLRSVEILANCIRGEESG